MKTMWQVFRAPLLFGALSIFGLLSALLGDGIWEAACWVALGAVCVAASCLWLRRPPRSSA